MSNYLDEFMNQKETEFLIGWQMYSQAKETEGKIVDLLHKCLETHLENLITNEILLQKVASLDAHRIERLYQLFNLPPTHANPHKQIELMEISIKEDWFSKFCQNLNEFIAEVENKRKVLGGNGRKYNWAENGIKLTKLRNLAGNLIDLRNQIFELEAIKNNHASLDQEFVEPQNLPLFKFIEKYKGLKQIQTLINEKYLGRKAKHILENYLYGSASDTLLDKEAIAKIGLQKQQINSSQLINILISTFTDN